MLKRTKSLIIIGCLVITGSLWAFTHNSFPFSIGLSLLHWDTINQKVSYTRNTLKVRDKWRINSSNSVFFVETNQETSLLPPRVMCALESAARHNPDRQIYHIAQMDMEVKEYESVLNRYPNIKLLQRNFYDLIKDSPVESIYNNNLKGTSYQLENFSDIMRLMVLFFFGGVYLDTDVISLKELPTDKNFLIPFRPNYINFAVAGFKPRHPFIYEALSSMALDFQPEQWAYNGPDLVTRVAKKFCPAHGGAESETNADGVWSWECADIQILHCTSAYPVDYMDFRNLFNASHTKDIQDILSKSFALHYWNKMIRWDHNVKLRKDQPLYQIFEQNCPMTESIHLRPLLNQPFHIRE